MTAGSSILKNFSWPLKSKKRARSGSGGSWDLMENKKKSTATLAKKRGGGRKISGHDPSGSSLEIVAPASSDVEFKYSWPIDSFVHQVKSCRNEGIDSKPFDVNVNGVLTTWTLSVRFWVGENGERLSNPFVLCLNLVNCKIERSTEVSVKYKFGIYNRVTEEPEMGPPERVSLKQENCEKLQSIGYKNIAINDKHVNSWGDVLVFVRLSIIREEEAVHSLSSDLGSLINDEKSSDLILEAGERKFMVHRNILAARSPVFADLLARMEDVEGQSSEEQRDIPTRHTVISPTNNLMHERRKGIYSPPNPSVISPVKLSNIQEIGDTTEEDEEATEEREDSTDVEETAPALVDDNKTNIEIHTEHSKHKTKSKQAEIQTKDGDEEVNGTDHESDIVNVNAIQPKNSRIEKLAIEDAAQEDDNTNSEELDLKNPEDARKEANEESLEHDLDTIEKENTNSEDNREEEIKEESKDSEDQRKINKESKSPEERQKESLLREEESSPECIRKGSLLLEGSSPEQRRKDSLLREESSPEQRRKESLLREEDRALKKLVIDDLPGDTVEQLLKYIYTDSSHNVELFSQTLLAASDRYKLPGLKQHCEKHLGEIMSPVNVADILLLSDNYSCKDLKKAALTYCSENHSYIMKDSKWKTIERENPLLFAEAIALVAPDTCDKHAECIKKGGNRYEAEKSAKGSLGGRKKSHTRKL